MSQALKVIRGRLISIVPQLLALCLVTFILIRLLPGNPAQQMLGPYWTPRGVALMEKRLGLDQPLPVQYFNYVTRAVRGDLGNSWYTSNPVAKDIAERLPATLELITIALFLSLLIMVPLGIRVAAPRRTGKAALIDRALNKLVTLYALLAGSLADFWLALILIFVFYAKLGIAPDPVGALNPNVTAPDRVTGFLTIDSLLTGDFTALSSYLGHLVLPVATLVFVYGAPILKMTMAAMREIRESPYMENARAMGLKTVTLRRYAFRNALPPVITIVGVTYGFLLGGAVLVETIFGLNGIGAYGVRAVLNADYAAVQGFVLIAGIFVMATYLVVDLVHMRVDPRVRL